MKKIPFLSLSTFLFLIFSPTTHAQFSDVQKDSLNYLYQHHYIDGYSDGTFGPKKEINRAELVTLLLRAEGVSLTPAQNCFPDVQVGVWYHDYVCTAKELGYVQGYQGGLFEPEKTVNHAEAAKMIVNILQVPAPTYAAKYEDEKHAFSDVPKGTWFHPFVDALDEKYYVDWTKLFQPALPMNREEVAEILFRTFLSEKLYEPLEVQMVFENRPSDPEKITEIESLDLAARDFFSAIKIIETLTLNQLIEEQEEVIASYEAAKKIYLESLDKEDWNYKVMMEDGPYTYGVLNFFDPEREMQTHWRDSYQTWAVLKFDTVSKKLLAYDFFTRWVDRPSPIPNMLSVQDDKVTLQLGQGGPDPAYKRKEGPELLFQLKDFR